MRANTAHGHGLGRRRIFNVVDAFRFARVAGLATMLIVLSSCLPAVAVAAENNVQAGNTPRNRVVAAIDELDLVQLPGHRHPLASVANEIGRAADELRLERLILALKSDPAQIAALDDYLVAAHDPSHALYAQWLDAAGFGQRFGVTDADIAVITGWLIRHGFAVDEVAVGRRAIVFSGTAAQVRAAFRTDMRHYLINGKRQLANAADPQIPRALADVVEGVVSLHDFRHRPMHVRAQTAPDFTSGTAHYMAATDFHTIYNVLPLHASGINGGGRSIAILGRSNVVPADMQTFRATMNLPANAPQIIINGSDPGLVSGDHGESDLDLEWAGAVATGATIKLVTSASTATTDGIDLSAQYAVNNNVADVISVSYGQCEAAMGSAAVNFYHALWQQAAALGISVLVSSGDSGAAGCDSPSASTATQGLAVNGLCTSPYSTCVGGTQFADTTNPALYWSAGNGVGLSSALSYIPEVVWNESGTSGGSGLWSTGGGASIFFTKPVWQSLSGVPALNRRYVPDVSLTAAVHDGYLVYSSDNPTQTQTLYVFGGTSASAPSFAGIMAMIVQKTGYRQGSANARLYALATRQANNGAPGYFHHITAGDNSVPGRAGFSASVTSPYYNRATGLGSIDVNVLVTHWTDVLPVTTTTLAAAPNPGLSGQIVTLTASVSGATPTGAVQFIDGAVNLGAPIVLSGGIATLATSALAAGTHNITAAYAGDPGNQSSLSAPLSLVVLNMASVTLSANPQTIVPGQPVVLLASVTGVSPTGTIQFRDGAANLGASIGLITGSASLTTTLLTATGLHNITAAYSGDASNSAAISSVLPVTVSTSGTGDPGAGNTADVPTLPEWALMILGMALVLTASRARALRVD